MADRFSTVTVLRVSCAVFLLAVAWLAGRGAAPASPGWCSGAWPSSMSSAGSRRRASIWPRRPSRWSSRPEGLRRPTWPTNALVSGTASALAPLIAGLSADWLETQRLSLRWPGPRPSVEPRAGRSAARCARPRLPLHRHRAGRAVRDSPDPGCDRAGHGQAARCSRCLADRNAGPDAAAPSGDHHGAGSAGPGLLPLLAPRTLVPERRQGRAVGGVDGAVVPATAPARPRRSSSPPEGQAVRALRAGTVTRRSSEVSTSAHASVLYLGYFHHAVG